jgi:hypothetical protein
MLSELFKLVIGVILVFSSYYLVVVRLKRLLKMIFPNQRFLPVFSSMVFWVMEMIGVHLLLDPIAADRAMIILHSKDLIIRDATPCDTRIEIWVANISGTIDRDKQFHGQFDQTGNCAVLADFGCFQNYARLEFIDR